MRNYLANTYRQATSIFNIGPAIDGLVASVAKVIATQGQHTVLLNKVIATQVQHTTQLNQISQQESKEMALQDDINSALADLDAKVQGVAVNQQKFADDLAAALANNDTAAAQAALDGIRAEAAKLGDLVTNQPAP